MQLMILTDQVPEVNGGDAALKVHLSVLVEGGVGVDLELSEPVRRHRAVVQRRVVRVRPRRPVRIAIPVVVAEQVVLPDLTETWRIQAQVKNSAVVKKLLNSSNAMGLLNGRATDLCVACNLEWLINGTEEVLNEGQNTTLD